MTVSNYPSGFPNGVTVNEIPLVTTQNKNGNVFHVDSNQGSNGNKGTFTQPFATLEYAIGRCTADQGDLIIVAAGHIESVVSVGSLDLDVAGVTIQFMGEGSSRATIDFSTLVDASMFLAGANMTLVNPRFTASIDALTGTIFPSAANIKIVNAEWVDGTGIDTTDCIKATAAAIGLEIDGWKYIPGDGAGTQKQSHIQLIGVDNCILKNIDIVGDFGTGNIENITDEVLNIRIENSKLNNTNAGPIPGIVLDANATGMAKNLDIRIASGTTYVSNVAKLNWDRQCLGYNADGEGGDPIGTAASASLEGKIDAIQTDVGDPSARTNHQDIENMIGVPDTANSSLDDMIRTGYVSTAVTADRDGSLMERTEFIMDEQSGTAGIATFPAGAQAANNISTAEVLRFTQEAVRNGTGTALDTDKSLVDALGTNGTTVADSAVSVLGPIGANNNNNAFDSSTVVANEDGSVLERLEQIGEGVNVGSGTSLAANKSLADALGTDGTTVTDGAVSVLGAIGADNANNAFASTSVVSNADGSVLERLEYIQNAASPYLGAVSYTGVCDGGMAGSTTTIVAAALAGYGDDYFNDKYYMQVIRNVNSVGNAPETQVRQITDYVSATGTFTVTAFGANVEATDNIAIFHEDVVLLGRDDSDNTIATTNVAANADGSLVERQEYIQDQVNKIDQASLAVAPAAGSIGRFIASGGTALGTPLADSKSLVDALGTDGTTVTDGAVSVIGAIGADNANNAFASTSVVANEDGSVLERLEQIQEAVNVGAGTSMAAGKAIADALGSDGTAVTDSAVSVLGAVGADNANNAFASTSVVANEDGSVLERLEFTQIQVTKSISKNLASITTADVFTVAGGLVKVLNITGFINTGFQAAGNNTQLVNKATVGGNVDLCAVLDVTGAAQASFLSITGTFANALVNSGTTGVKATEQADAFIVGPGTIEMNCAGTTTGDVTWYIEYQAMDVDATIVAA